MKTKALITLILLVFCSALSAQQLITQLSNGGTPWTYTNPQSNGSISFVTMPSFDVNSMRIEDSLNIERSDIPWRFGYNHQVNFNLNNSGTWTPTSDGGRVWRLGIVSPGALSMNLAFQYVSIPAGGQVFVFNTKHSVMHGGFDQSQVSPDLFLATEFVDGDSVIVEYYEPVGALGQGSLELYLATHRYRDVAPFMAKAFGSSGACENNVQCFMGMGYDNQIKSVMCLVSGGNGFCTGSLVNNTCSDGTPYVLTANHCYSNPATWVFRFNWQSATCVNPGSSPSTAQSITGGTLRARHTISDFCLVQINSAVPLAYNPYYAGWDRNAVAPTNVYCIHHPSGDIKKISFTAPGACTSASVDLGNGVAQTWQTTTWVDGVTEPGSSGSPLFNAAGLIVGQLYGGPSNCSCENNAGCGYDYYGQFAVSWNGNGTSATRLSDWLMPAACNTGVTTQPGYDPNASGLPVASFTNTTATICAGGTVTYTNTSTNALSFSWVFPGGTPPSGSTSPITVTYATAGTYTTTLTAVNGANTSTATVVVTVNANPAAPTVSNTGPYCSGSTIQLNCTAATSYSWTGPLAFTSTAQNPTRPASTTGMAGVYTVQITNAVGCTNTGTTTVVVNATPTASATNGGPYCVGATIQLNSVGGSATDDWTGPGGYIMNNTQNPTRPAATLAMAGVYTVTVTNVAGCTSTSTTTVVVNANPIAPTVSNTGPYCSGATIQLNCSAATSYSWTGPLSFTSTSQNPTLPSSTVGMAGTYTVQITNAAGCTNSGTTAVVVNASPTASATNGGPYCVGATIQLNSVGGSATDDWTGPGGYTSNNTQNPTRPASTLAMAGVYTVTVTNVAGCTSTSTTTVVVNANPIAPTVSNTGPYCSGSTIQLNCSASTSYSWTGPLSFTSTSQNPTIPGSTVGMAGTYTVQITNAAGCTNTGTTAVVVNASPTASATNGGPYCVGNTIQLNSVGGSATDDWTGPNAYSQNNTQNPSLPGATLLMGGVYTVTVTNVAGCTSTSTTAVTVNALPTPTATNTGPYCVGATIQLASPSGSATDDWTGPNSYSQNNSQNPSIAGATLLMSGNYTVTVTNVAGCSATATTTVVVNANPTPTASNTGAYCAGATIQLNSPTGSATDDWTGPNSYVQNDTQNPSITSSTTLMDGVYTVTVTNVAGCSATATTTVVVNALPTATSSNTGPYCTGNMIQLNAGGGAGYSWIGPSSFTDLTQNPTIAAATVLNDGVYTVTVTNAAGCTSTSTTTVVVNNSGSAVASNTGPYCAGATIDLSASAGGTSYSWTGPAAFTSGIQSPSIASSNVAMSGDYTVVITYGGGCTSSGTTTVIVNANPSAPLINPSGSTTFCAGNSITLASSYGSGNVWSTSETTAVITVNSTATYTVVYTDVNNCTSSSFVDVTVNPLPTVSQSALGTLCVNYSPVILTGGTPVGGVYSGTGVSGGQFDPAVSGTGTFNITYTYTDGNSCSNSAVASIDVLPCAGIGNNTEVTINIYPNPVDQYINITGLENQVYDFSIVNALGQVIKSGKLTGDGMIDLGIVASGTYYLKLNNQVYKLIRK